jgi:hypothetical protein
VCCPGLQGQLAELNLWHNPSRTAKLAKRAAAAKRRESLSASWGRDDFERCWAGKRWDIVTVVLRRSLSASGLDAKAIKLRRRDAAFEDSDDDIHDLAHNALAHQVPGGLAPAARRKSMVISASAPALGALAAASG